MEFVLSSFSCFNIEVAYSNFTFWAPKLPVSLRAGENCRNFRKTSTPPPPVYGKCKLLHSYLDNVPHWISIHVGFAKAGAPTPKDGGLQPIIWANFPENCMKLKENWTERRGREGRVQNFTMQIQNWLPNLSESHSIVKVFLYEGESDAVGRLPLRSNIFSISCSFFGNFDKIICRRPLVQGILDPPLWCDQE